MEVSSRSARRLSTNHAWRFTVVLAFALLAGGCSSDPDAAASTSTSGGILSVGSTVPSNIDSPPCESALEIGAILAAVDVADRRGIAELPAALSRLAEVVPDDLDGDVSTLTSAITSFVAVLERYNFDVQAIEADPAAQAELAELDAPQAKAAVERIQAWLGDQCA